MYLQLWITEMFHVKHFSVRNAQNVSRETFQGCSVFEPCYNIEEMQVTIIYQVRRRKYAKTTFGGRINLNHKL